MDKNNLSPYSLDGRKICNCNKKSYSGYGDTPCPYSLSDRTVICKCKKPQFSSYGDTVSPYDLSSIKRTR